MVNEEGFKGKHYVFDLFLPCGSCFVNYDSCSKKNSIIELENWSSYWIDFLTIEYISSSTDFLLVDVLNILSQQS